VSSLSEEDLQRFVDGELDPSRRAELELQIAQHPDDAERVRSLQELNAGLKALLDPELSEPVPQRFLQKDGRRSGRMRWIGLAAGLFAVGIATGWLAHGVINAPLPTYNLPKQAAIAHVVYSPEVRHPVEVDAKEEDHLVRWLSKRLGTDLKAPKLGPLGYELVGGRLLSGPNGPVAHFMFQDARGARLTLYVSAQRGETRETAFRFSQEDRVSVFYWIDGRNGYALSGELGREQLLRIANAVYQQLNP
jgi:anti-sigma factor RsiW